MKNTGATDKQQRVLDYVREKTKQERIIEDIGKYINNKISSYWIKMKYWWNQEKISYILRNIRRHNNELQRLEIELIEATEKEG